MLVLVVDDNAINRTVVKCMLEAADVDMAEADDAETGLSMIETAAFDLVLLDLRMPGMDGLEAIRAIRARQDAKAALPVIVITADTTKDLRAQVLAAGADDLLHKPVDMHALFDAMAKVLNRGGETAALLA